MVSCLLLLIGQQSPPAFDATELTVSRRLQQLGGSLEWVRDDHGDSKSAWVLSVDIENKNRTFDASELAPLRRLYACRILGGSVVEQSLNTLSRLPKLGLLVITGSGVGDLGLAHISQCKRINKLDLAGRNWSGDALAKLARMRSLRRAFFYNVDLKDRDLRSFETMTFLDQLTLPLTVSEEGVKGLARRLPKTTIRRI